MGKVFKSKARQTRFERLVERYATDLYRYAVWLCGSQALAEDLVQEAFMRAWRSLDSLKEDSAAKSWLFTIVRRENARVHERQRQRPGRSTPIASWTPINTIPAPRPLSCGVP